jgi:hydroxypyruvate reductase
MPRKDIPTLRDRAIKAFEAGVKAADPASAVHAAFREYPLPALAKGGRYIIVAVGKAACKMADCAIKNLPGNADFTALAVTNFENVEPINGCEVLGASHPEPCEKGLHAGRKVISVLEAATVNDIVVMLISGGASALLPTPVSEIGLHHKIQVNNLLLSNGLDIYETNLVRQSLSQLKGGGALNLAQPADVHSYILSDVLGDDLRVVGSGPSICPIGTHADARRLLIENGIFTKLPNLVRTYLENAPSKPKCDFPINAHLIASNQTSLREMAHAAGAVMIDAPLVGDVQFAAQEVVQAVQAHKKSEPLILAFGGETTVTLTGKGKGGRNQELALRVARAAKDANFDFPWCFLSGGTDGRDGPTDAAGAVVDNETLLRMNAAGIDVSAYLQQNDSYTALNASGDLLMTGATGTNVADLQLFVAG